MNMARLARIPARCKRDVRLILMLKNWREALRAELTGAPLKRVKLRNGASLTAPDTLSLAFLFHEIWVQRTYTPPGFEIKRGDVVIDIGGNIGVFATYAATAAPDVRVYSYEPFPGNIEWLRRNIEQSGLSNVKVIEQAVGGGAGERTLHVNPESWIVHSLVRDEGSAAGDVSVTCVTLDQVFEDNGIGACDLLKLDCEGSEYEILMGCRPETLRRVKRIVGEYHEGVSIGKTGQDLRRFLEANGFSIDYFGPMEVDSGIFYATNTVA
jgi:FkbM family methyltransferase